MDKDDTTLQIVPNEIQSIEEFMISTKEVETNLPTICVVYQEFV